MSGRMRYWISSMARCLRPLVPVGACQERAAQSVPFRTLVSHCWCQLMFVPHNHDMTSIDGVGQALPKWVPLLARLRLLE